ncbi:MAG TPA: hypothetical protein VKU93_01135 [Terracidiphilus sp.]|jgi:hypothetical protein|nr:hypothetical protein [Terracidiphilus sp.]
MSHARRRYSPLMQTVVEPLPAASGFAGVLAALAGGKTQSSCRWEDDPELDPEPDVATLSYERALSFHARYRPDGSPEAASRAPEAPAAAQNPAACAPRTPAACEEKRMRASVTLRMSKAELAQLQQRAAEAGLTVSAYLRSCAFEMETLRAQVKQALAELRTARQEPSPPPRASWLARFLGPMRLRRPAIA